MALNYTKKTIDHFRHPKNIGSIKDPDGLGEVGNMVCGDQLSFFLKVEKGKIKDVKFLSFGCASNIATASVMTERIKGMTVEEAKNFKWAEIVEDLGGLPQQKIHCSVMAVEGLKKAIADYEARQTRASASKSPAKKKTLKKVASAKFKSGRKK